jgi:hypothetical protein
MVYFDWESRISTKPTDHPVRLSDVIALARSLTCADIPTCFRDGLGKKVKLELPLLQPDSIPQRSMLRGGCLYQARALETARKGDMETVNPLGDTNPRDIELAPRRTCGCPLGTVLEVPGAT